MQVENRSCPEHRTLPGAGGGPGNKTFSLLFSQDILFVCSAAQPRFLLCPLESSEAKAAGERQAPERGSASLSARLGEYGRGESWMVSMLLWPGSAVSWKNPALFIEKLSLGLTEGEEIWNTQLDGNFSNHDWFVTSRMWEKPGVRAEREESCGCCCQPCPWLVPCTATSPFPGWDSGTTSGTPASSARIRTEARCEGGGKAFWSHKWGSCRSAKSRDVCRFSTRLIKETTLLPAADLNLPWMRINPSDLDWLNELKWEIPSDPS